MHVIRSEQQGSWQLSKLSCHLSRGRASAQQVCALTSVTADTASSVTRPVKQSIHTISITLQNKDTIPASMSEMVTVISDAAANDAATTIGGGVAPKRAARRGKNHIFAQGESAGCTIRRHALQILVSDSMFAFVCGLFYITYFALVGRTKSSRGDPSWCFNGLSEPRFYAQLRARMACRTHPLDADGKSHTPAGAPHTKGVTEMEGLGRANLAKDGKSTSREAQV